MSKSKIAPLPVKADWDPDDDVPDPAPAGMEE